MIFNISANSGIMMNQESNVRIVEFAKNEAYLSELRSKYSTSDYYDVSICGGSGLWKMELTLKPLEKKLEKTIEGSFSKIMLRNPESLQHC